MHVLVVADSSPVISFSRAGKLQLIRSIHQELIIPRAVYEEIVVKGRNKPGAEEVGSASWISFREVKDQNEVGKLRRRQFGAGESEAIVLANELGAGLLADEGIVIREARRRGIQVTSSLVTLVEAKNQGLIASVKKEIDGLIAAGFRTTPALVRATLERVGE